jgi:DNA-binding transcriptional LysR family regulator
VEVQLREMTTGDQVSAILARQIDIGFVRPPLDELHLRVSVLVREDFVAVLPRNHRLARARRVALKRLAAEPFILFPRHLGPRLYDPILSACQRAGFSPKVAQEAMHVPTIVSLVAAGAGVALLPESVRALRWSGVVYRPLEQPTTGTAIALASRKADDAPAVRHFTDLAERIFRRPMERGTDVSIQRFGRK